MSDGRKWKAKGKGNDSRDGGPFLALPWGVLDSPAYLNLSHPARSLLMELGRQYMGNNNGRLLASGKYLRKRGWKSSAVITRAKRELLASKLIHELVAGHRPNKASWYALTWCRLDRTRAMTLALLKLFGGARICR